MYVRVVCLLFFFFFQAEDGIRDGRVTGVQTCALPISKSIDPLALVLASHTGNGRLDSEIRRLQERVRAATNLNPGLERLGWLFVAKARESFDPGYYKLAEACAKALE